jgi:hypothetical protein
MKFQNKLIWGLIAITSMLSGCGGTHVSKYTFNDTYKTNIPVKDENCYDASILLGVNSKRAKDISEKVLIAIDSTIEENTDTVLKAQRNRHVGVFVGSGGEELAINLKALDDKSTFATVTTKTGFVGGAGQRAWSCEIVDKMAEMAAK